jgi:hypothetical protein
MEKDRLGYIENVRIFLTVLVVLQHVVRAYGREVWWFVRDGYAPLLERFTAVNSSFFMSLFFFISFYFIPGSYDKKGFLRFHKDRFFRLFVPLSIYVSAVVSPMMYFYFVTFRGHGTPSFPTYFFDYFLGFSEKPSSWTGPSWPDLNLGHLWFIEHLILYGIAYSLFRLLFKPKKRDAEGSAKFPSIPVVAFFASCVGILTFLVRTRFPLYDWISLFGFIQIELAHFPFYFSMFFIALYAAQNDWLNALPESEGKIYFLLGCSCASALALFPIDSSFFGGWTLGSFAYTLCETYACFALLIGLISVFKTYANRQSKFQLVLSKNTYMVYIIHLPIVVILQNLALPIDLNPYMKFFIISISSLPLVFIASVFIRKIPYAKRYL